MFDISQLKTGISSCYIISH